MAKHKNKPAVEPVDARPAAEAAAAQDFDAGREAQEIAQERAKLESEKAKLEEMKKDFEQLAKTAEVAAAATPAVPQQASMAGIVADLLKEREEFQRLKGELQIAIGQARRQIEESRPKEKLLNQLEERMQELIIADPPLNLPEPPPGSYKRRFRVALKHCAVRTVETWVYPGTETMIYEHVIQAFNKTMGVRGSEHKHEVQDLTSPVKQPAAAPQPIPTTDIGPDEDEPVPNNSVLAILRDELNQAFE